MPALNETALNYADLAARLTRSLTLSLAPISVSFSATLPEGIGPLGHAVPAGCRFWQEGIDQTFATTSADHSLCSIGVHTHNLESTPFLTSELMAALKVFGELEYVREQDVPLIPVLKSRPEHVIYAPLAETPLPPDVVLLFVNSSQTLVLTEAAQQIDGEVPPAMGRPACAVIPQVKNSGRASVSLGCCGARAYLDVLTDGIAVFAIPGHQLTQYADRVDTLSKANHILASFHLQRRKDVEAGKSPTIAESLAALSA